MASEGGFMGGFGGDEEVKVGAVELSVGGADEDVIRREVRKEGWLQKRGHKFYNLCSCCIGPVWKDRYFVLSGGYLFRFTNERHTKPKGRPVNLVGVDVRIVTDETCYMTGIGPCFVRSNMPSVSAWATHLKQQRIEQQVRMEVQAAEMHTNLAREATFAARSAF